MNKAEIKQLNTLTQSADTQAKIDPALALELLQAGNQRFLDKQNISRNFSSQISQTANGQYPFAVVLSCIDSRIPTEIIFDQGIGDIFNARIAGNFVNEDILGSMEFACKLAGSRVILVLGHTSCGAVKGACDNAQLGNLTGLLDKIKPAIKAIKTDPGVDRSSKNKDFVNKVARKNVELTMDNILDQSEVLKEMADNNEIAIVGGMYHVESGKVEIFD